MPDKIDPATGLKIAPKHSWEDLPFPMSFANDMDDGATIASVTEVAFESMGIVPGSADVTIGATPFSGQELQPWISAGQTGEHYKITGKIESSLGKKLVVQGMLYVVD